MRAVVRPLDKRWMQEGTDFPRMLSLACVVQVLSRLGSWASSGLLSETPLESNYIRPSPL